jgi:hypothetical protein
MNMQDSVPDDFTEDTLQRYDGQGSLQAGPHESLRLSDWVRRMTFQEQGQIFQVLSSGTPDLSLRVLRDLYQKDQHDRAQHQRLHAKVRRRPS